jgi:hypothetical protein
MATRKRHRDAFAALGYTIEEYFIEGWPPVWGTAIQKNGKDVMVIETHGCHTEDDSLRNKYVVKGHRGHVNTHTYSVHRLKREALGNAARLLNRV